MWSARAWMKTSAGCAIWMRVFSGSRRNWNCCGPRGSWRRCCSSREFTVDSENGRFARDSLMLETDSLKLLADAAQKLQDGFAALPADETVAPASARMGEVLAATAERLQDNYPYFHPM